MCRELGLECRYNIGMDHLAFLSSKRIVAMRGKEYERLLKQQMKAAREPDLSGASLRSLWIRGKQNGDRDQKSEP